MDLVIDVGNTETVVGLVEPGRPPDVKAHWRLSTGVARTADEYGLLLRSLLADREVAGGTLRRAVLGSVVPEASEVLGAALAELVGGRVHTVEPTSSLPIRLEVEEPRTVGADRIVNTLAAKEIFARDTIVVDLGTATTYDCITADGVFLGGVISPGIQAGLEWLGRRTAKLPRVSLRPPDRVVGRRTETCIQSGVFFSAVDAIDGMVGRIRDEWGAADPLVVATGGLAPVLAPHTRTIARCEPFLTLQGLALAGEYLSGE